MHPRVPKQPLTALGNGPPQAQQWESLVASGFNAYVVRRQPTDLPDRYQRFSEQAEPHPGTKSLDWVVEQLKGLPFYNWDFGEDYDAHNRYAEQTNNRCCAVHAIGVPENKPTLPRGFFPYEKQVFEASEQYRYVWIKKATGLGISEFYLYYFLWEACNKAELENTHVGFITGPRLELTVMLMDRLKNLPILQDVGFSFKNTVFEINNVRFEAYPSNDLRGARGIDKVSRWFLDEADFWEKSLQNEARTIAERYIAKSRAKIFMVSTPHLPNGLFDVIEHEDPCRYHRIFLHFSVGVGYIYTQRDIEDAKLSPSFDREYGLQYLGQEGDVFDQEELRYAVDILGPTVNYASPSVLTLKSMGIDPGYAKSKYAICITQYNPANNLVEVIYAQEFYKTSPAELTERAYLLSQHFNVTQIFADASQNGPIMDLKGKFGEPIDYQAHALDIKKRTGKTPAEYGLKVIALSFGAPIGDEMISKCQDLFNHKMIAIPPVFRDLIVQLRSATKDINGKLDKKMLTMDLFDAFRAAIYYYNPYRIRVRATRKPNPDNILYATGTANQQGQQQQQQVNNRIHGLPGLR